MGVLNNPRAPPIAPKNNNNNKPITTTTTTTTMVKIELQLKATLENVTSLRAEGEDFRWYLKVKCLNCGEESKSFVYLTLEESHPLKGGRGEASMVSKCKLCGR